MIAFYSTLIGMVLLFAVFAIYKIHEDEKFLQKMRQIQMDSLIKRNSNKIELYILVDSDSRICYTGSYSDCKNQLTKELKLIKLEGVL